MLKCLKKILITRNESYRVFYLKYHKFITLKVIRTLKK